MNASRTLPRTPRSLLLPVLLTLLAGCMDRELPTAAAPGGARFSQSPDGPVVNSLADPGDGICDDAECTLREAIAFASAGATITFGATGTITLTQGQLTIGTDLTIDGPGAASLAVTVSSGTESRVLRIVDPGTTVAISGLTIRNGFVFGELGGGILNAGTLTLTNSTVSGNTAGPGGGIHNIGALTLTNSTVSGNTADTGGGISNGGTLTLTNSTVSGNSASFGGGIYNTSGTLTLTNSTVSDNSASSRGGGIYIQNSTATLRNTIVANSTLGGDCVSFQAQVNDLDYNLIEDGSCLSAATSLSGDPLLGPLQDNGGPTWTHALLPGSPAIDHIPVGTNGCGVTGQVTEDQRGVERPQDGNGDGTAACDIGAFEREQAHTDVDIRTAFSGTPNRAPGEVRLSDPHLFVQVLSIQQHTGVGGAANAVRIGTDWLSGTPANQLRVRDLDGDGVLDVQLRFSIQALQTAGHLGPGTGSLVVWGRNPTTGELYRGEVAVSVTGG